MTARYGTQRGGGRGLARGRPSRALHPIVAVTLLCCGGALVLSLIEPDAVAPVQSALARHITPVVSLAADAAGLVATPLKALITWAAGSGTSTVTEAEHARRVSEQARIATLEHENRDLKALTGFARGSNAGLVSARVVMRSSSPLAQRIVLDAGSAQGVHEGSPVVAGPGLIGRVVQAFEDQASAILLTDRLSRVPVLVGADEVRAVLVGAGDTGARLLFITPGAKVGTGDLVTTSGVGGLFPRGLQIGVVARTGDEPEVALAAGDDDPLVVGVMGVGGPATEAVTTVSTRAQRTLGQTPLPAAEAGSRGGRDE